MKLFELDNYDELLIGSGKGIIQVDNKTRQYIFPSLLFHGRTYQNAMLSYSFVAAGIRDDEKPELFNPNRIGLLFNVQKSINTDFKNLGHGYVADYYFGELMYGHLHMVVMELPKFCHDVTVKAFLNIGLKGQGLSVVAALGVSPITAIWNGHTEDVDPLV
jgi:hypothetical protein